VPVLTGGDHFSAFRFYQVVYPVLLLCLFYFVEHVLPNLFNRFKLTFLKKITKALAIAGAVFISFTIIILQIDQWKLIRNDLEIEFSLAREGRDKGAFMYELFSELTDLPSVGVISSGGIKFAYPGNIVDLMGLNNTMMAHNHGDRTGTKNHAAFEISTFFILLPDVITPRMIDQNLWKYNDLDLHEVWANQVALKGLFDENQFLQSYTYAKISEGSESRYALVGWFRNEMLNQLFDANYYLIQQYEYSP
jgi:hypothetical protein